jgi:hypothetical protein
MTIRSSPALAISVTGFQMRRSVRSTPGIRPISRPPRSLPPSSWPSRTGCTRQGVFRPRLPDRSRVRMAAGGDGEHAEIAVEEVHNLAEFLSKRASAKPAAALSSRFGRSRGQSDASRLLLRTASVTCAYTEDIEHAKDHLRYAASMKRSFIHLSAASKPLFIPSCQRGDDERRKDSA